MRARLVLAALLVAAVAAAAAPAARQERVLPVDEAVADPELFTFRGRLLAAVAARDTSAVLAAFAPDVKLSFGDDHGVERLRELLRGGQGTMGLPADAYWGELGEALALGGAFQGEEREYFVAPYTFARFPDHLDAFESLVVVARDVRVRAAPDTSAEVLATLSYEVVAIDPQHDTWGEPWRAITLDDGRAGYVADALVRSPLDYRVVLARGPGGWRIVSFLAGD